MKKTHLLAIQALLLVAGTLGAVELSRSMFRDGLVNPQPNVLHLKRSPFGRTLALAMRGPVDIYWHRGSPHSHLEDGHSHDHDHDHAHGEDCEHCEEHGSALSFENGQKLYRGESKALGDAAFMARKEAAESSFRGQVDGNPKLREQYGSIWKQLAALSRQRIIEHVHHHGFQAKGAFQLVLKVDKYHNEPQGKRVHKRWTKKSTMEFVETLTM